jgi:DNA (cytosine-5)-methyltransferase 1
MISQGHSGANHHNNVDDPRNSELFVTIREIDRLKPDIFILENVPGMKRDRHEIEDTDGDDEDAGNFAVAGIKRLRHIGYQVRMVQLDARSFGSPQNRIRLFLICARQGVPLPSLPTPTHANPEMKRNIFVAASKSDRSFYVGHQGEPGSGPLPAITVRDAISDLPDFEYLYGKNQDSRRRIPRFNPLKSAGSQVGFDRPEPYRTPPVNDFQARQRDGSRNVENHYTPPWTPRELDLWV